MARKVNSLSVQPVVETQSQLVDEKMINKMVRKVLASATPAGRRISISLKRGQEVLSELINADTISDAEKTVRGYVQQGWMPR